MSITSRSKSLEGQESRSFKGHKVNIVSRSQGQGHSKVMMSRSFQGHEFKVIPRSGVKVISRSRKFQGEDDQVNVIGQGQNPI